MPSTKKVNNRPPDDEREAFLTKNIARASFQLPPAAVDDLIYFRRQYDAGRAITIVALQRWLQERYGIQLGRSGLRSAAKNAGVDPWWSK